jgi:hypothetical protein
MLVLQAQAYVINKKLEIELCLTFAGSALLYHHSRDSVAIERDRRFK